VNDQFAVPAVIVLRSQGRLEASEHPRSALPQNGPRLPGYVFAKELRGVDRRARAEIAERRNAMDGGFAEEVSTVLALHMAPDQMPSSNATDEANCHETRALSAHDIARLAVSACAIVTPSAYSRSPPTGSPRAILETVSG